MTDIFLHEKFRFNSESEGESFIKSLSKYGSKGHEHLEIKLHNDKISLKTTAKACWFLRIIEKLFYKSPKRQVSNIAKVALLILESNSEYFSRNQNITNKLIPLLNKAENKLGIEFRKKKISLIQNIADKILSTDPYRNSKSTQKPPIEINNCQHEIKHQSKIKKQITPSSEIVSKNHEYLVIPDTAILCADNKIIECQNQLLKDCWFFHPNSIKNITANTSLNSFKAEHNAIKFSYDLRDFSENTIKSLLSVLEFFQSFELSSSQKGIAGYILEHSDFDELNKLYELADYIGHPSVGGVCAEAFGDRLNKEVVITFLERELQKGEEVFNLPPEFKLKVLQFLAENLDSLVTKISQLYNVQRLSNQDLFAIFSSDFIRSSEATIFAYLLSIVKDPESLLEYKEGVRLIDCIRLDRLSKLGFDKIKIHYSEEVRENLERKLNKLIPIEKRSPSRLGQVHLKKLSSTKHQILWTIDQASLHNNSFLKSPTIPLPVNFEGGVKEFEITLSPFIVNGNKATKIALIDCLKGSTTQGCNFTYQIKLNDYRLNDNSGSRLSGVFLPVNFDKPGYEVIQNFLHEEELEHIENTVTKEILIEYTIELTKLNLIKRNSYA